ncbi:MAG: hypothetical protein F3745_05250, partial [Nitrospinae bacterium]|nr:hypothetical protein [Nitrospinota bacterium]
MKVSLLKVIVFLASFLIFQIELILGKVLLPGFGGGYLVWGIAMVLFQGLLLLGYLYVHICNRLFRFDTFKKIQVGLFLISFLLFPLNVEPLKNPSYQFPPVVEIVLLLSLAISLPFLILSSISVYLQVQLSRSDLQEKENPYLLYAASNFGAFVALLTYPLIVEPALDLSTQFLVWEIIYVFLAGLFLCAQRAISPRNFDKEEGVKFILGKDQVMRWLLLSGGGAALFLAVTNELTLNLAPVPLLWVLPLGIYLLTLVLTFKQDPFCPGIIQKSFHLSVSLIVLLFLFKVTGNQPLEYLVMMLIGLKIPWYWVALVVEPLLLLLCCFVICLVCH